MPTAADHELSRALLWPRIGLAGLVWPPLLIALVALIGSLWLSVGMGLKACRPCFYQRTFVMGVVAVLGIGLLTGERHWPVLNVLALPMAVSGFGVAVFHEYLELTGKLECPSGIMGIGTAPQQSPAVLAVLLAVIILCVVRGSGSQAPASVVAIGAGVLLAVGSVVSAPPIPTAPSKPYETQPEMCRPPFRSPQT